MTYCYSVDEERYHGDFATLDEARSAAEEHLWDIHLEGTVCLYWVAETKSAMEYLRKIGSFLGDVVVERVEDWLSDDIAWDDSIIELSEEHKEELANRVLDYLEKHATFNAYGVKNAQQFEYVVMADKA